MAYTALARMVMACTVLALYSLTGRVLFLVELFDLE